MYRDKTRSGQLQGNNKKTTQESVCVVACVVGRLRMQKFFMRMRFYVYYMPTLTSCWEGVGSCPAMPSAGGTWPFPEKFRLSWKAGAVLLRLPSVLFGTRLLSKQRSILTDSRVTVPRSHVIHPTNRVDPEGSGEEWAETCAGSDGQAQGDGPSNCCQSSVLHDDPSFYRMSMSSTHLITVCMILD